MENGTKSLTLEHEDKGEIVDSKEEMSSENIPDDYQTCQTIELEDGIGSMIVEPGTELPSQNLTVVTDTTHLNSKSEEESSSTSWHPTQRFVLSHVHSWILF